MSTQADPAAISFDLAPGSPPAAIPADVTVWRSELPAEPGQALAAFQQAQASLQAGEQALEISEERLERLRLRQASGLSFAAGEPGEELPPPESETLALLAYAQESGQMLSFAPGQSWDSFSFGPLDQVSDKWGQAVAQFKEFMQRLEQIVTHYAWVETRVQGRLWARTSVSWTGDMDTAWYIQPADGQSALHERTLKLALDSRAALLRTFAVVAAGALKLSTLLATPAGPLLALPAALSFINQVRAELAHPEGS